MVVWHLGRRPVGPVCEICDVAEETGGRTGASEGLVGAALVTFAISADNAASYLPLLRATSGLTEWLLAASLCGLFALLVGAAVLIGRTPAVERTVRSVGRYLEPPLYGALSVAVLYAATDSAP